MPIREGRPFSVSYKALRGDAGGMSLGKAFTEGPDDSFDEAAPSHHVAIISHNAKQYILEANIAPGLLNMAHLYGLGDEAPVKTEEGLSGVFNQGFLAKVAHMDPAHAYHESATNGVLATLTFRTAEFVNAYEANADDIARVKVSSYMDLNADRGMAINRLFGELLEKIEDHTEKNFWNTLYSMGTQKNYMLHIFTMRENRPLRVDHIRNFFPSLRQTYYKALQANKKIILYLNDPSTDTQLAQGAPALPKLLRADNTNYIDPLGDRKKFPALHWQAVVRKHSIFGTIAELILYNGGSSAETGAKIWIHPATKADGTLNLRRIKTPEIVDSKPRFWNEAEPYVTLTGDMNAIDELTAKKQREDLNSLAPGSEFQSREDLRGIMTLWAYRLIGGAYWPNKSAKEELGYGDQRNAHEPRCVVAVQGDGPNARQRKMNAVEALRIQSNKHNNRMDEAELIIRFIFAATFGTLVRCYTDYANGRNKNGRTTPWDISEFVLLMKDTWLPPVAPAKKAVAEKTKGGSGKASAAANGIPAVNNNSSSSEENSRSASRSSTPEAQNTAATASVSGSANDIIDSLTRAAVAKPAMPINPLENTPKKTNVSITKNPTEELVVILKCDKKVADIPYLGQFHITDKYLTEVHTKLGDERFIEYVTQLAALNSRFFR